MFSKLPPTSRFLAATCLLSIGVTGTVYGVGRITDHHKPIPLSPPNDPIAKFSKAIDALTPPNLFDVSPKDKANTDFLAAYLSEIGKRNVLLGMNGAQTIIDNGSDAQAADATKWMAANLNRADLADRERAIYFASNALVTSRFSSTNYQIFSLYIAKRTDDFVQGKLSPAQAHEIIVGSMQWLSSTAEGSKDRVAAQKSFTAVIAKACNDPELKDQAATILRFLRADYHPQKNTDFKNLSTRLAKKYHLSLNQDAPAPTFLKPIPLLQHVPVTVSEKANFFKPAPHKHVVLKLTP